MSIDDYAKDGEPGRSELHVVLTIILCGINFYLAGHETEIHKLTLNSFSEHVYLTSKPYGLK